MRALLSLVVSTTSFASSLLAGVAAAGEPFNWSPQVDDPIHTPAELVESMHSAFGYNHCRAVHAKGIILQGEFTPDTHAKEITKAPHLQGPSSKVTVRFSDFSGVPSNVPPGIETADMLSSFYSKAFRLSAKEERDVASVAGN
jgi:catalase